MDGASDLNDGCQPHREELEQEMEEKLEKTIKNHYDFIVERMSPEFGLIDRLLSNSALTKREKSIIEEKKITEEKNETLLDCLTKNHKLKTLVELLGECDQKHLTNYLKNDGNYSDEFDEDWPLTDGDISTIDINCENLVDLLDASELIGLLFSTGVINRRQREYISSKPTSYEKNGALLDILRRSSLRSYWQTIRCLHQSNQSHIADILTKGGVIMRVDVHLGVEGKRVNETEQEIVTKISNLLSGRSSEEVERILDQLKLIGAKTRHSVSLYFLCNQLEEVERFEKLTKDGRLKEIVESLFSRLIKTSVKIKMDFNWKSDIFTKCLNMFQEKEFPLTTINRLPFEALDLILQKSYLKFTQRQNQDQNREDATFIMQLASVDFCWFKRITNRRYRATVWSHLSGIYKVKDRASYLYKCNQEFIESNLIRLGVDKNALKASDVLGDTEYALNTRTKTSALRKRPPMNGAQGLSVFASQRNGAAILDYLRHFYDSEERTKIKVLQNGEATIMDCANDPNDGCQPHDQEREQEMEEKLGKTIKSHYDFIVERMSPEFGLIDRLFTHRALTRREKSMIEDKRITEDKNEMILDCLSKNHKLKTLVESLGKCDQKHLAKYLENDGNRRDEFDGDWPLTEDVISTIDCNYADLLELLDVSNLLMDHLYETGVISRRQRVFLSSKPTSYEKNEALLDILRRSSLRSYWQAIRCLHPTYQSHIAEILTKGGELSVFASQRNGAAILDYLRYFHHSQERAKIKFLQKGGASVRVDVRGRDPNSEEILKRLQLSKDEEDEESTEVKKLFSELYDNGMEILNLEHDRNTVVWIWCKSTNALEKLKRMNESKTLARLFFQLIKVDHQCTNIDCYQLKKDIVTNFTKQKYLMQIVDQNAATKWHRLIENGVPQDKALEWLKNEATSANAPIEYHDAWIVHNDQDIRVNNDMTTAECLALRIYSNTVHKFYSKFNDDCNNSKWEHYIVFTSLLQSALCKRRRRCSVKTVEVIPDDEYGTDVNTSENDVMPEEIETLTPPFRIFPAKRIYFRINSKNYWLRMWSTLTSPLFSGSLLGAVVGDCIGALYEFTDPSAVEKILQNFNKLEDVDTNRDQSFYTVDTCMTLALAESLTRNRTVDIEDLIHCFCQMVSINPYQNYGSSTINVLKEFKKQRKDDDHFAPAKRLFGGQGSKGIGGAVRIAPLAIYYLYEHEDKFNV